MSKDMLGSLVRASVNLTQPQLNVVRDVANRFTGNNGVAWQAHIKKTLRAGLPDEAEQSSPVVEPTPAVLELVDDCIELEAITAYDPNTLETRPGLWVSPDFVSRVRSKAKLVTNLGPVTLSSYRLVKNAYDREITPELGEGYLFDESEACARVAQMIAKQANGEEGDLLNDGSWNLFYLAGCVVGVGWGSDGRGWHVSAWGRGGAYWGAGGRAFSRN